MALRKRTGQKMMGTRVTLEELVKEAEKEAEKERENERKNRGNKQSGGCTKLHKTKRNDSPTRFCKYRTVPSMRKSNVCKRFRVL